MDSENTVCPVCTLYLRPGMTLKSHLSSHPKQKVIEALVRLSNPEQLRKIESSLNQMHTCENSNPNVSDNFNYGNTLPPSGVPPNFAGNHSFIYQQFMSTSGSQPGVLNMNPLGQQYVTVPTVLNPPVMCPPYVYQQQQVIMSSGPSMPQLIPRPLPPVEITSVPQDGIGTQATTQGVLTIDLEHEPEGPDVVIIDTNNYSENVVTGSNGTEIVTREDDNKDFKVDLEEVKTDDDDTPKEETQAKETDQETNVEVTQTTQVELDVNLTSPKSNDSDWSVRIRSDLSKACQTQIPSQVSPSPTALMTGDCSNAPVNENGENQFYYEQDLNGVSITTPTVDNLATTSTSGNFEHNEPTYTVATSNVVQSNEQLNFMDVDGMPIILNNDFINNKILLTIGGIEMEDSKDMFSALQRDEDRLGDESVSRESSNVNIRADERMPPRGELSGQESNGASENTWSRIQYHEGSSGMSTSYDLLARESWEGSDASDAETPCSQNIIPTRNFTPDVNDMPTIVSVTESPLNFKCSSCTMAFKCLQERQKHMKEVHSTGNQKDKKQLNIIGSKIGKGKVKKLVVKPKKVEVKEENNFENVFTNKLKVETKPENCAEIDAIIAATADQLESEKANTAITSNIKLTCSLCGCTFSSAKELRLHKQEEHNIVVGPRHKCMTCGEVFPNDFKYTTHLREHPLECRLCGKLFYRRQNLQMHLKCHLGVRPYKCDYCEKSFLTKQKLNEHTNVHTGETPLKCTFCDETFRRHSNLVQHKKRHHFKIKAKVKDYICHCGEIFHSLKKLAWHKEVHDPKPKSCSHCSEKFVHMSSLTRHMRRAHNDRFVPTKERASENVECPICKGVYLRTSLEAHIKSHNGHRPFTCLICGKDFTTKWNLKLHKWTHAARVSKPFKCDQCRGAFIRETDYVAHMNSHKSVRPYTCNYCGAQFIRKYNCQRHVKEHEKGKTYSCQVCGKAFHRSYYLKDHMRIHSGLRPYSCHVCGKTSTTKSNHNKHVRIHHAREPVSTEN